MIKKTSEKEVVTKVPKKRGRKPKGGKIINNVESKKGVQVPVQNIILHLKCFLSDLEINETSSPLTYKPIVEVVESFQFYNSKNQDLNVASTKIQGSQYKKDGDILSNSVENNDNENNDNENNDNENEQKHIWEKLRILSQKLHYSEASEKRSACFWCTCDFDNPPIFIPKLELNDSYQCYGCFCSPECATAHLFNEDIDSSTRFERYSMLNYLYCKIYDYEKNIKPAPNPHYTLDKFHGNLTIQEYRSLLKNERLMFVIDKPLVRIMPELHIEHDEFNMSNKFLNSSKYKVKKKAVQSKKDILNKTFNFN